jgi:hypothetical protein
MKLVSPLGLEPRTITLKGCCSTIELGALIGISFACGLPLTLKPFHSAIPPLKIDCVPHILLDKLVFLKPRL